MFSQEEGIVTGVINDDDGLPIPGVNVIIKNTSIGTQTDFDGKYSIMCAVGDVLVFSYVGFTSYQVKVTYDMFDIPENDQLGYGYVRRILSSDYKKAIDSLNLKRDSIPSLNTSNKTYSRKNNYFSFNRIKDIEVLEDKVKLTFFKPDIYFETGFTSSLGVQFIQKSNLPVLQNTFSQGSSTPGGLMFQGAETGNIFSYGPNLNTLEFDGTNYPYDTNGNLVNLGAGNGNPANSYDNNLFRDVIINTNQVFFNINTSEEFIGFNYYNKNAKDIFNREQRTNHNLSINYRKDGYRDKLGWNTFFKYNLNNDNQPNINGFQNNLLLNSWATPVTFSNQQGDVLANNTQRSFSTQFNNPEWMLNNNTNSMIDRIIIASIQNNKKISDDIFFKSKLNYVNKVQEQNFGVLNGTAGFQEGFLSKKDIKTDNLNAVAHFEYEKNNIIAKSIINYNYDDLDFELLESSGFSAFSFVDPQDVMITNQSISRSTFRLLNQVKYDVDRFLELELTNNSYYSSIQNDKWFLPSLYAKLDLDRLLYLDIDLFTISSSFSLDVKDMPLYYSNLSHNSLAITSEQSLRYTTNNDLFINSTVDLEELQNFEADLSFGLYFLGGLSKINFNYYNTTAKGSVFPVLDNNNFSLQNVGDIRNYGFEINLESTISIGNYVILYPSFLFSRYNNKVLALNNNAERVAIAGFSNVSQNLIVNQPAGVIVGSAYLRDEQNNIVIGSDGFPLVNDNLQIIGNPIPDFNIGFENTFKWKNFRFNILLDIQKGGDIWNGTQNVLNYLGTSQQSANERNISNFIFNGVTQDGNPNNIAVDFFNENAPLSENRFVRYGYSGVAEDAIVDASYVNIKSIEMLYQFDDKRNVDSFFREIEVGIYANNLFSWTSFGGHSPYSSLFGNNNGQALNFFNMPLFSEIGMSLNIKI